MRIKMLIGGHAGYVREVPHALATRLLSRGEAAMPDVAPEIESRQPTPEIEQPNVLMPVKSSGVTIRPQAKKAK